jgi:hypothetical protein
VELTPKAKEELNAMLKSGEIFSIQEFVRRAIDNELARRPQGRISEGDAQAAKTARSR